MLSTPFYSGVILPHSGPLHSHSAQSLTNILFSSHINPTTNCGPLSDIMLSDRPCNFHILSLNNHANPSTDVFSVVGIKCTILVNWSTTTRIESYSCAKGNLVMKSADIYAQGFSGIEFGINLSAGSSMWFLFFWQELHPFTYCFTSFVTFGHQKFLVTSFTIFYYPPCPPTGMS